MADWFISDLHLSDDRPELTKALSDFLTRMRAGDRLLILGDLFDAWIGDDVETPLSNHVRDELRATADRDVALFFLGGNRDFLVGPAFLELAGVTIIADGDRWQIPNGQIALLMHGDSLCTDDVAYQEFRDKVRSEPWQTVFLAKSIEERIAYAEYARRESQAATQGKTQDIMDVNPEAVVQALSDREVHLLIHGHTHRPAAHHVTRASASSAVRWVLPDWHRSAGAIRADAAGLTRCFFSLPD